MKLRDSFGKDIRKLQSETRDLASALSIITTERNVLLSQNAEVEVKLSGAEKDLRNANSRVTQLETAMGELVEKVFLFFLPLRSNSVYILFKS